MTDTFATLDGFRLTALRLYVASVGPWYAECEIDEAPPSLEGRVEIVVGKLALLGTVTPSRSGAFGLQRKCRVVAGAGGWASELAPKSYHNDAGVKSRLIVDDAAREIGESVGDFAPAADRVGLDFVRERGVASNVLERAIGADVAWWVDYRGVTQVGVRETAELGAGAAAGFELLDFDPRMRVATLAVDDPGAVAVGSILRSERLDAAYVVTELDLRVSAEGVRVLAYVDALAAADPAVGAPSPPRARLAGLLAAIARRSTDAPLVGLYRYRVVQMTAEGRVELQAVRKAAGLPDVVPVSQWPGAPGVAAELAPGAEVLVTFVDSDRTQPIIAHYAGPDGVGFVPAKLTLGGTSGSPAARQNDAVEVLLPPAIFSGTIGGVPATGVLTFPLVKTLGVITAGSSKVEVAS